MDASNFQLSVQARVEPEAVRASGRTENAFPCVGSTKKSEHVNLSDPSLRVSAGE